MVAKSYQKRTLVGEPYVGEKGKMYQKVLNENTGKTYEVRWYSEDEYYKMYPEDRPEKKPVNQKKILGFEEGYITIFKGDQEKWEHWLSKSIARYCRFWGWYIVSTDPIPFDVPAELELVRLDWDRVGQSTGELKSEEEIQAELTTLLYNTHPSVYQGAVGDRLELNVTVIKTIQQDKYFGGKSTKNTIHTFEDACGNHYMWDTGAKNWAEGSVKKIRGTVKEHKIINSVQTTVLTRCMEVMK